MNAIYAADAEPPYDMQTEIGFDDEADFECARVYLAEPETAALIGAEEEKLFDKSSA